MTKAETIQRIHEDWLTLIMRGDTAEETLEACEALIAGGARLIEAAFTTPDVSRVLRELRRRHGDGIVLSAGTVRTPEQARIAVDCGVDVIVAPDLYPPVVEVALRNGKVSIPGCATPTEIAEALQRRGGHRGGCPPLLRGQACVNLLRRRGIADWRLGIADPEPADSAFRNPHSAMATTARTAAFGR